MEVLKDYQTLVAATVALIAAFIGFSGVIYTQRRAAKIAEIGRGHAENMAKVQGEKQRKSDRESFQNAILGELAALETSIAAAIGLLSAQISIADQLASMNAGRKTVPRIAFRFATPVFDSHVARIGIIGPDLSFRTSKVYGQIKSLATNADEQAPEMEAEMASQVMASVKTSLANLSSEITKLQGAFREGLEPQTRSPVA